MEVRNITRVVEGHEGQAMTDTSKPWSARWRAPPWRGRSGRKVARNRRWIGWRRPSTTGRRTSHREAYGKATRWVDAVRDRSRVMQTYAVPEKSRQVIRLPDVDRHYEIGQGDDELANADVDDAVFGRVGVVIR